MLFLPEARAAAPGVGAIPLDCGNPFENAFGPYDYRTAQPGQKRVVEQIHFTPRVEALRGGESGLLGGDIDYTLRVFPNHSRALMSMIRLGQRMKTPRPVGAQFTVECYVERAVQFRPDDLDVRQIRGVYRSSQHRYEDAIADFAAVIEKAPNTAGAHYNLGLAYFETKNYERAEEHARLAKSLGLPLDGLAKKLKAVGRPIDK